MELGTAAHKLVLGVGAELVAVDAPNWTTRAAKEQRDAIRGTGAVPLLRHEHTQVQDMAGAVRAHPIAGKLISPERGQPEQSIFWKDPEFGVWRRCRLDHMPNPGSGRMIITDYKTAASASPDDIPRTVANFHYHMQDAWYREAVENMFPGEDVAFVFVFQEKTPPYLITCVQLEAEEGLAGARLNRAAIERYRDCAASGIWPGYADDIIPVSLPPWARRHYLEDQL